MDYDNIVIGGGVVGLACAMRLSRAGMSTLLVERHVSFGNETSSRNSQVIHAGMYYPTGSLKAKMCAPGNRSLYAWCDAHGVGYRKTGKFIIAVEENEADGLEKIYKQGEINGVEKLQWVDGEFLKSAEPHIKAVRAIWSPETGIINSHELMESFIHAAQESGCDFAWQHSVITANQQEGGYELTIGTPDGDSFTVTAKRVVNAAGLEADLIAEKAGMGIDALGYRQTYCRGHYFRVSPSKSALLKHLIYPVPPKDLSGLGIHITLELDGSAKLGPDTQYLDERIQDYSIPQNLQEKFYTAVSRYFPVLKPEDITPDQSGIRPKLAAKKGAFQDFIIQEESAAGFKNWINLIGIESPGLTCCLEIAAMVEGLAGND
jgi:L-2-hydroxyglutarate oxidase LhgO